MTHLRVAETEMKMVVLTAQWKVWMLVEKRDLKRAASKDNRRVGH